MLTLNPLLPQLGGRTQSSDLRRDVVVDGSLCIHTTVKCSLMPLSEDNVPIHIQGLGKPQLGKNRQYLLLSPTVKLCLEVTNQHLPAQGWVPGRSESRPGPGYARLHRAKICCGAKPSSAARLSG